MQTLSHSTRRKSQTLPGGVRCAEWAPTNTCAVGSTPQVPDFPSIYIKQGMLTGNMAAPVMQKWLPDS